MNLLIFKPAYYAKIFFDIINFVKSPVYDSKKNHLICRKLQDIFIIFLINSCLILIVAIFLAIFFDEYKSHQNLEYLPLIEKIFIMCILAPFIEETIFRLPLKFYPVLLTLLSGVLSIHFCSVLVVQVFHNETYYSFIPIILISFLIGYLVLFFVKRYEEIVENFWKKYFRYIFYLSCVSFGWLHIYNFDISYKTLLLMPILTLPQLISGINWGYVRMNYGFFFGVLLHGLNNFIAAIATLAK